MSFQWSDNAEHIQSLYRPWDLNSGYSEAVVTEAEQKLQVQFPVVLRRFYRAWGARDDLVRTSQILLSPNDVFVQDDALIICAENQWVKYWAISSTELNQDNPAVTLAWNEEPALIWFPSHARLSDFLDFLTYQHAFDGGAVHGAYSKERITDQLWKDLCQYGEERILQTYQPWLVPETDTEQWKLVIGQQYALDGLIKVAVATSRREIVEHISTSFQITWEHQW